ncbi:hypothetical protein [Paenibacillus brevis]|uniref:hypothetical protein n=1 Tax=Paenibacillus brevis TaxID=2841508 RepID=UPI001C106C47|nr:hypothetical protein [Paenibacillus brevis]
MDQNVFTPAFTPGRRDLRDLERLAKRPCKEVKKDAFYAFAHGEFLAACIQAGP